MKEKFNNILKWLGVILTFIITLGGILAIFNRQKADFTLDRDDELQDEVDDVDDKIDDIKEDLDDIEPTELPDDQIEDFWKDNL